MTRFSRSAALTVAFVVLAGLTGCSEDEPAAPRATATASATATPPGESASPKPAAASKASLSPIKTVEAWVEARNSLLASGKRGKVDVYSHEECDICADLTDPIAAVFERGGRISTEGWTVLRSRIGEWDAPRVSVVAVVRYAGGTTVKKAGAKPATFRQESHLMTFGLLYEGDMWRVDRITYLS